MAATSVAQPEQITMVTVAPSGNTEGEEDILSLPDPAHVHRDPNADPEAGLVPAESNPATDSEALPAYKEEEEDMAEPLPPYMARVRQVMWREEPLSTIMPDKKTGRWVVGSFIVAVVIVIGVGVGVRVGTNNNSSNNNP